MSRPTLQSAMQLHRAGDLPAAARAYATLLERDPGDPVPYNGGTTTCEALWMGVPVVTLPGRQFCSRMSASLLRNVGLEDLAATDEAGYARIAADLAGDRARLRELRAGLRETVRASPVCDAPRAARELEASYRAMWRAHLDGRNPDAADRAPTDAGG